jgi:hypothetical protein
MSRYYANYGQYLGAQRCCDLRGQGPQGIPGPTGPSAIGERGYTGPTGPSVTGPTGRNCKGDTGPTGPGGGARGDTGPPGDSIWTDASYVNPITLDSYNGIGVTGMDVLIGGNLYVSGEIDPISIALSDGPSNPTAKFGLTSAGAYITTSSGGLFLAPNSGNVDISSNLNVLTINGSAYPPAPAPTPAWSATLQVSNNAGTNNVDMNNNDITNVDNIDVDNIDLQTINGSAYPPIVPTPTLDQVLTAGNTSTNTFQLINGTVNTNTQSGQQIVLENGTNGQANLTANVFTLNVNDVITGLATTSNQTITSTQGQFQMTTQGAGTTAYPFAQITETTTENSATIKVRRDEISGNSTFTEYGFNSIIHNQSSGPPNNDFKIETNKYLTLKATDDGSSGYGIFIDPATPNIYYSLNPSTADRITLNNTGTIESVNVGSQQAGSFNYNQMIFSDFASGQGVGVSPININFSNSSFPFQTSSLSLSQLTFNGSLVASSYFNANTLQLTDTNAGASSTTIQAPGIYTQSPLIGYTSNYNLRMVNVNASVGNTTGVPSVEVYKSGRNVVTNDVIYSQQFYAKNYLGIKTQFGKIESVVTSSSAPTGDDGALDFYTCVNGTSSLVMRLNGADNENNSFRPLDMNGNNIRTSTGNLTIDTSGSSGPGILTLSALQSVNINSGGGSSIALNTSGGNFTLNTSTTGRIIFTGTNLQSGSAGGSSGQYLIITLNGIQYKIALLNLNP